MTTTPTVKDAYQRLERRKAAAAGEDEPVRRGPFAFGQSARETPGLLAGTDLIPDELDELVGTYGASLLMILLTHDPVSVIGSAFVDGLLTGLELAAMRAEALDLAGTNRELRRRLTELAEAVLEADDAGELVTGPITFRRRMFPERDLGTKGIEARDLAERIRETIR